MVIQFQYSPFNQVFRFEINSIIGLLVDFAPQILELLTSELLTVKLRLSHLAGILWLYSIRIEDSIQFVDNVLLVFIVILAKVERSLLLLVVVFRGQLCLPVDVALCRQC